MVPQVTLIIVISHTEFCLQKAFSQNDEINRGYEDMGNELGGDGFSKTQFFLTNACWINNFITVNASICDDPNPSSALIKNLGNLYALGHDGLICMGSANDNLEGEDYSRFTDSLKNGKDFGEAFLAQANYGWTSPIFSLLGAGSLHAQPYVQFGSDVEQNKTITTSQNPLNLNQPILIQGDTVRGAGNWTVTSYQNSSSPFGTHSEIDVRPETDLAGEVDLKAN